MGPPLTHKKSHEKSIEKDPFIVAFTNNNDESIKTHRRNCKGDAPYNPVQSRKAPHSLSLYIGIFLLIVGLGCFIGSSQIEAAVLHLVQSYTSLVPGGESLIQLQEGNKLGRRPNVPGLVHPSYCTTAQGVRLQHNKQG